WVAPGELTVTCASAGSAVRPIAAAATVPTVSRRMTERDTDGPFSRSPRGEEARATGPPTAPHDTTGRSPPEAGSRTPQHWARNPLTLGTSALVQPCLGTQRLEQLNRVAGRVLDHDLTDADPLHHVGGEPGAGRPQPVDRGVEAVGLQLDAVPAAGRRLGAVRPVFRSPPPGAQRAHAPHT